MNTDMGKEFAEMLMQATDVIHDRFKVLKYQGEDTIVYGRYTNKEYRVLIAKYRAYPIGCNFEGRIHPYMGKFKTCGITSRLVKKS